MDVRDSGGVYSGGCLIVGEVFEIRSQLEVWERR